MAKENKNDFINNEKLEHQSLDYIMSDRFARYSKYIIQQRALPDIRDGLKPVQRRILFSMSELGLQHNKTFKKSARIVGDVIGKYHPHGDSSIYEALVRMGQDWKMNMPLVEMHGNKGSIDDDPAAAMRYTETKLEKIASLMLDELDKKTVPFAPNFDDTEKEPVVLPSYLPNLLVNGARGIASGFATEIPPHNLLEILDAAIAMIRNPEITLNSLLKHIKGPDFPTGGIIYGTKGIEQSFERGQGRITICSKYEKIVEKKETWINITEIPYGVIKSKLVRQIDELRFSGRIDGIKEVRDQTDRNGISIAIFIEQEANADVIINYLLQKTDLKIYYSYNMISIKDNAPRVLGISKMLQAYILHIKDIKRKAIKFDYEKYTKRLEIINGLIRVSEIPDQVIKVIRESTDSKRGVILNLMEKLGFSEIQATAIAELRLYRLNKTDVSIYLRDKEDLLEKIKFCKNVLDNQNEFDQYLISILKQIKKEFGVPRKTLIYENELEVSIRQDELIKSEPTYISLSRDGYLKRFSPRIYESNELNTFGIKDDDYLIHLRASNTTNKLLVFSNLGNCIIVPIHKILECKWKDTGQYISDFAHFDNNERIVGCLDVANFETKGYVVLVTKQGIGKRVPFNEFNVTRISKPIRAISFKKPHDELVGVKVSNGMEDIMITTDRSYTVKFSENEVPIFGLRPAGNTLIKLDKNFVTSFIISNNKEKILLINDKNKIKQINFSTIAYSSRATRGGKIITLISLKPTIIAKISNANDTTFIIKNPNGIAIEKYKMDNKQQALDNNFLKISNNIIKVEIQNDLIIDPKTEYFDVVHTVESSDETMNYSEQRINDAFKKTEEKIKEIDDNKIDEILKKYKI
ncbi:MAG: DNA topoisomerase IV subunit A [Metamycoplasmataceae bacterium]